MSDNNGTLSRIPSSSVPNELAALGSALRVPFEVSFAADEFCTLEACSDGAVSASAPTQAESGLTTAAVPHVLVRQESRSCEYYRSSRHTGILPALTRRRRG